MTYEEIVAMMQTYYADADASKAAGHYAIQFNVVGEGEGAFYIELADGKVNVQPYDYVDRNAAVFAAAESLKAIAAGQLSYTDAVKESRITVEGDQQTAAVLDSVVLPKAEKAVEPAKAEAEKTVEAVKAETEKTVETVKVETEKTVEAVKAETEKTVETVEAVKTETAKAAPKTAAKTTAKKAPARKRAVSKAAANAKGSKNAKKAAK